MTKNILALMFVICLPQQPELPGTAKVHRIQAYTRYSASIIFEYAYKFMREGEPISEGAIPELRSQLLSTGLFVDIKIRLAPAGQSGEVNVEITPIWHKRSDRFLIDRIVFKGFTGMDEKPVRSALMRNGIMPNAPLFKYSLQEIKRALYEAIEKTYVSKPEVRSELSEKVLYAHFEIRRAARGRYIVTVHTDEGGSRRTGSDCALISTLNRSIKVASRNEQTGQITPAKYQWTVGGFRCSESAQFEEP